MKTYDRYGIKMDETDHEPDKIGVGKTYKSFEYDGTKLIAFPLWQFDIKTLFKLNGKSVAVEI